MDNIEFFNKFTLALLEKLHDEFPEPISVDVRRIGISILPEDLPEDVMFRLQNKSVYAVHFLIEQDYIRVDNTTSSLDDDFGEFRLTEKGLASLNKIPEGLTPDENVISKIKSTFSNGIQNAGADAVSALARMIYTAGVTLVS